MAETAETEWVIITENEPLNPGDRIRMHYSIIGPTFLMAVQIAAIEKKLESDPRFTVIRNNLPEGDSWVKDFWLEILIKTPSAQTPQIQQASITAGVIAAVIAAAVTACSMFCWLSLRVVERMEIGPEIKEIIEETGWTALKIAAAAIIGVIALKWWG